MTDEWHLDVLDLDGYLARIGHTGGREPTAETLRAIHRAHVEAIRFENLDIILGRGISTTLEAVQAKLVHAGRGGYCYEHATLLGAVLQRLGFDVVRLLARVGRETDPIRSRSHLVLSVGVAEQRWLADVGFGSGLLEPIPLAEDGPHRQGDWTYRLRHADGEQDAWHLQERQGREWVTLHRFDEVPQHAVDIEVANWFTSTNPRSPFTHQPIVLHKDGARLWGLRGRQLTVQRPDLSRTERQLSDDEVVLALTERFGQALSGPQTAALVASLLPPR